MFHTYWSIKHEKKERKMTHSCKKKKKRRKKPTIINKTFFRTVQPNWILHLHFFYPRLQQFKGLGFLLLHGEGFQRTAGIFLQSGFEVMNRLLKIIWSSEMMGLDCKVCAESSCGLTLACLKSLQHSVSCHSTISAIPEVTLFVCL